MLFTSILAILLQVGPNPNTGTIPENDDLLDRPPRETVVEADSDAASLPGSEWLSECLDQLGADASRAHTMAQLRRNTTSGAERIVANLCLGLAATELGRWDEASGAFIAARDETPADEGRARARFGTMAGNTLLAAGNAQGAVPILETAQEDARTASAGTLEAMAAMDAARALVAADRPQEALAPLETATRLLPDEAEGWLLKATLLRRLGRLAEAQEAIERAGTLAPQDLAIGLEAGLVAVLSGREDAARESWQSVIALQPDSAAAATARGYLDQIAPAAPTPGASGTTEAPQSATDPS